MWCGGFGGLRCIGIYVLTSFEVVVLDLGGVGLFGDLRLAVAVCFEFAAWGTGLVYKVLVFGFAGYAFLGWTSCLVVGVLA